MDNIFINQYGEKSIYVSKNEGEIYVGMDYIEKPSEAFKNGSYELLDYVPTIQPSIRRDEVDYIKSWIENKASDEQSARLALVYGKAGIGKSVVMHNLLKDLQTIQDYCVLGIKSDQIEFVDTNDLSKQLHLAKPLDIIVREMSKTFKRVIILIDQIDALSLSLSSNRMPLRSLLQLIERLKSIENVRVVISCRPYDLEYDPILENLRIKNKWEIKEFTKDQVKDILNYNKCKPRMNDNLLRFLGNPLHLYLFMKVQPEEQLTNPLSSDLLYHQLWRKYILDESVRKVDKQKLLELLDSLTQTMYERQELSVHSRKFETNYSSELNYLLSSDILLKNKNCQLQFFHQTLFDYVYARRFTEKGNDLLENLRGKHQGLFLRSAVKSILSFLREQNPSDYINILNQLLYAKNEEGKDLYRFHLKSLALSNMVFFEKPLKAEINLINRKLFQDKIFMTVVLESIYSPYWFKALWDIIDSKGGWRCLDKEYKGKVVTMCERTLWQDADCVLDILDKALDFNDEEDCKYIGNILQHYDLNCDSNNIIYFYNRLVKSRKPLEQIHLLRNILITNPSFVCKELLENIKLQLEDKEEKYVHRIRVNHEEGLLYTELLKKHHNEGISLLVDILNLVYEKTKFGIDETEIYNSTEFFSFRRITGGHFIDNFTEEAVNILIDDFLNSTNDDKTLSYISTFALSGHVGFVFIALYIYTSLPEIFNKDVYKILINRPVLANAPCWVEYQAVEALKTSFPLWDDEQKLSIMNRIMYILDKGEGDFSLYKNFAEMRLKNGFPLLDIDLHKGKALNVIPKAEMKRLSLKAYRELLRIERKFGHTRLKNDMPSKMISHGGWTSLNEEQGMKMSPKSWLKSMLTYTNDPLDWEKPSLTGQCHLFRNVVSKFPEKFLSLINDIVTDKRILFAYPLAGMQGLLDAGRTDDAMKVLKRILDAINNDVNSSDRGFSLRSLLFALHDIVKSEHVPEIVFQLLCNALLNAKEPDDDIYKNDTDVLNVGINQARGNAGYMLVECAREKIYAVEIFNTIERISETASVYTRAAVLENLAVLNLYDEKRNVELFKKLMHDYEPRLMSLPVHNYNPLVYFINYAVDELMDFFNHAVETPECYKVQVVILWLAWSHNNRSERIKELLDRMCNNSQDARISLLNFLSTLHSKMNEDALYYILYFMEPQFDSENMGIACDDLFHHAKDWQEDIKKIVAEAFVKSPMRRHKVRGFIYFLASYAINQPIQTLKWLEAILENNIFSEESYILNQAIDVIIQSYNGIKTFNDNSYQYILEHAMDLIDAIMQSPNNKLLVCNFINKLDNE